MKLRTDLSRHKRCISKAVDMEHVGSTFCKASDQIRISLAPIHYRLKIQKASVCSNGIGRAPARIEFEEDAAVRTLCRYPDRVIPFSTKHPCDAVEIIVNGMDAEHR